MARRVNDTKLDSKNARAKLAPRREPYWCSLSGGLALGYRKGSKGGHWVAKQYSAEHGRRHCALGPADDTLDHGVLNFDAAQAKARDWLATMGTGDAPKGPYMIADAIDDYFRFLESDGRSKHSIYDTRRRDQAFIRPKLGKAKVADLTADRLRRWRDDLVATAPRLRTRKGDNQKHRGIENEDAQRARRATANRTWTILRAALNHAFNDGKVHSDLAWRKVKPYRNVDSARIRYLSVAEAKRLINACDPEFRPLVQAALQTGARYGELCALTVSDFNPDVGTIAIRKSKSGKARHVVLTDEGRAFFEQLTAGRPRNAPMFGKVFSMSHQLRPMAEAVARAKIEPVISFHGLRHTWASLAVMNGMPLMVVARNLGHVDTRMVEKHYGHLAPSYVADAIRKSAPKFGFQPDRKVAALSI